MIRILALLIFAVPAVAQLSVLVGPQGSERPLRSFEELEAVPVGSTVETRFRVRNGSNAPATLDRLAIGGAGFSIGSQPALPQVVAAGSSVEFSVRFAPATAGSYSAHLSVNEGSYILRAAALPALTASVEIQGGRIALNSGAAVDFGNVAAGASALRRFFIENQTTRVMPLAAVVTGVDFRLGTEGIPAELEPGGSTVLDVTFSPERSGEGSGTLAIGTLRIVLSGTAIDPPLPELRISVDPNAVQSGQQTSVTVSVAGAVPARVTGELTLSFVADVPDVPSDAAVQFAGGGRSVAFEIGAGQNTAMFGTTSVARFQTGTTAGTLILSARAGSRTAESRLTIARAPVKITTARGSKTGNSLEVSVVALDNVRTAAQVSYTFFDTAGAQIGQAIRVDAAEGLRGYFRGSATGGAFALRAAFPVTGDAGQIASVEVEIANSAGTSRSERAQF